MICVSEHTTDWDTIMHPHQQLVDYLEDQAWQRRITLAELSVAMRLNKSQLGAIARGQQPGIKLCSVIADYFNIPTTSVLQMAGHIKDEERGIRSEVMLEIEALMAKLPQDDQMDLLDLARAKARRRELAP